MEPSRFDQLNQMLFEPVALPHVVRVAIDVAADESGQVQQLETLLKENPSWKERLIGLPFLKDKVTAWATEVSEKEPNFNHPIVLTRTLRILGKRPVRDALAGIWLQQVGGGENKEPPSFALKAEEFAQDRNWPYADYAFQAGLHYDWLRALLNGKKAPPDAKAAVDDTWKTGLAIGQVAQLLGTRMKNFELSRYAFGAGILTAWGGALMSYVFPKSSPKSWAGFMGELEKLGVWRWAYQSIREPARFDVTSSELRALVANYCGPFRNVDPALRYIETPYYLKEAAPDQYKLGMVVRLGQLAAGKKFDQVKFGTIEAQGMKDLGLSAKQISEVLDSIK